MAYSVSADLDNILLKSAHTDTQYETTKSFILPPSNKTIDKWGSNNNASVHLTTFHNIR